MAVGPGIVRSIVDMMMTATEDNPITKSEIAQALAKRFKRQPTSIARSVQRVVWASRSPRPDAQQMRQHYLSGMELHVVPTMPLGFYVTRIRGSLGRSVQRVGGEGIESQRHDERTLEELKAREGGIETLRIERWARVSGLAKQRKEKDHNKCWVCEQIMEDVYGEWGKDLADAHHLIWPAPPGEHDVDLDDLATLCPNCHRVLHRLLREQHAATVAEGLERLDELRRMVQEHAGTLQSSS